MVARSRSDSTIVAQPTIAALLSKSRSQLLALLQAGRIHNSIALAAVGAASLYAARPNAVGLLSLAYVASWVGMFLGIYLVNDVCDARIDAANKPWKPIPAGRISPRLATSVGIVLLVLGMTGVLLVGTRLLSAAPIIIFLAVASAAVLGITYSTWIKRNCPFAANCVIVGIVAICGLLPATYEAGSLTFLRGLPVYVFGLLGREYLKDIEDEQADLIGGRHTLPIVYGRKRAAIMAWTILLLTLAWSVWQMAILRGVPLIEFMKYLVFSVCCIQALRIALMRHDPVSCGQAQSWLKPGLLGFLALDLMDATLFR